MKQAFCLTSVFLLYFFTLFGCRPHSSDNAELLSQVDQGLIQSNKSIRSNTDIILEKLAAQLADPRTLYRTKIYRPKALAVNAYSTKVLTYIDSLKNRLNNEAKPTNVNKRTIHLFQRLQDYKEAVLSVDERMAGWVGKSLVFVSKGFDSAQKDENAFKEMIVNSSPRMLTAFLSRLQNNILLDESRMIYYLYNLTVFRGDSFESFEAIVGQNAQVLVAGSDLEITAGLGAFSKQKLLDARIGGKSIRTNDRGFVQYRIKTSKISGKYSIPIEISFTDQDGKPQTRTFNVEYKTVSVLDKK